MEKKTTARQTKQEELTNKISFPESEHREPHDGEYVSWTDTKMGGPYGILDNEDLKKVHGRQKNNQR